MSETHGTAQATESTATTVQDAAARIEALLSGDGQSDGDETQEAEASTEADEDDADEAEPEDVEEESADDAEEGDGDEEQPATYTVKIDGEEVKVTLDEALKGYQRTQDYTRKTTALAEDRKALDTAKAAAAQDREAYSEALKRMEAFFADTDDDAAELAQLRQSDPAEFAARVAEKQQRAQHLQTLKGEQDRLTAEKQRETAEKHQQYLVAEEAKLIDAIPSWKDADKRAADTLQIADYAKSIGVPPDELDKLADSRLVVALRDAAKWRALQAKKPAVQAKVDAVKTAKPGSASTTRAAVTDLTRSKQRLAKTGRVEDAASAIERMLG